MRRLQSSVDAYICPTISVSFWSSNRYSVPHMLRNICLGRCALCDNRKLSYCLFGTMTNIIPVYRDSLMPRLKCVCYHFGWTPVYIFGCGKTERHPDINEMCIDWLIQNWVSQHNLWIDRRSRFHWLPLVGKFELCKTFQEQLIRL